MGDLRRAIGSLDEKEFAQAVKQYKRHHDIEDRNLDVARDFLVKGMFQVDIATVRNVSRQLVNKQCKRIYDAHLELKGEI